METNQPPGDTRGPRLLRRRHDGRALAGVAAGLAAYLDLDVATVRIAFVVLSVLGGMAVPAYLACWLLIPEEGTDVALADDLWQEAQDLLHAGRFQ
jgi:phage shock protein PspC (stress-responsive transcriptional regulator)